MEACAAGAGVSATGRAEWRFAEPDSRACDPADPRPGGGGGTPVLACRLAGFLCCFRFRGSDDLPFTILGALSFAWFRTPDSHRGLLEPPIPIGG